MSPSRSCLNPCGLLALTVELLTEGDDEAAAAAAAAAADDCKRRSRSARTSCNSSIIRSQSLDRSPASRARNRSRSDSIVCWASWSVKRMICASRTARAFDAAASRADIACRAARITRTDGGSNGSAVFSADDPALSFSRVIASVNAVWRDFGMAAALVDRLRECSGL